MNRSFLFVPAHRENLIKKAIVSQADALIFDFEDSVPDGVSKQEARYLFQKYGPGARVEHSVWVRTNSPEADLYRDDLKAMTETQPDVVLHPKVESRDDFEIRMAQQYSVGITSRGAALIESPVGVANIAEICRSHFIYAVVFGNEDYEAELFCLRPQRTSEMLFARGSIALHAKANGVIAVDTVTIDLHDRAMLEERVDSAVRLGFDGKLCLSPKELELVNNAFAPSHQDVEKAHKILELSRIATSEGKGVSNASNTFVGPPMVKKARRILAKSGGNKK